MKNLVIYLVDQQEITKAKLLKEKSMVKRIAKRILLRYFKNLDGKSPRELLDDTDCIIEITPKEIINWKY